MTLVSEELGTLILLRFLQSELRVPFGEPGAKQGKRSRSEAETIFLPGAKRRLFFVALTET